MKKIAVISDERTNHDAVESIFTLVTETPENYIYLPIFNRETDIKMIKDFKEINYVDKENRSRIIPVLTSNKEKWIIALQTALNIAKLNSSSISVIVPRAAMIDSYCIRRMMRSYYMYGDDYTVLLGTWLNGYITVDGKNLYKFLLAELYNHIVSFMFGLRGGQFFAPYIVSPINIAIIASRNPLLFTYGETELPPCSELALTFLLEKVNIILVEADASLTRGMSLDFKVSFKQWLSIFLLDNR